jgi:filamentous hemagglutinin family protein
MREWHKFFCAMTIESGGSLSEAGVASASRWNYLRAGGFVRAVCIAVALSGMFSWQMRANPVLGGGNPVTQGTATFNGLGTGNLTVNTSAHAFINWQSFNIDAGETTSFVQPSASSVVWNQINDTSPSTILGNLNANGYVILQNQNGFVVGGSAAISAHGLLMTTASPSQMPDLASGGAWEFNAAPPSAKIINYGAITVDKNSSAFLIANDVENNGTISAPQGNIGLYAGQTVMVSTRPDGRGLSARVTLPAGSVDNAGKLVADGGSIAMQAQVVNQGGMVQANSAANVNGVIELVAGSSLTLGAGSSISATGDASTGNSSPGGFVVLKSGAAYSDSATSTIDVSGANGGQGGLVEVFGSGVAKNTVLSPISNPYAVLYNPNNITLSTANTAANSANPTLNVNDLGNYGQIDLFAKNNITLAASWSLPDEDAPSSLFLNAGNNITLNTGKNIIGGNDWDLNLTAGNGIYLTSGIQGASSIETGNGDIDLWAGKEVQVGWTGSEKPGVANSGVGSITTTGGGNISITAVSGNVNTGSGTGGYINSDTGIASVLGGISTAAGGNVTITAGGNVTSYLPTGTGATDAGSGAFDSSNPGNVTVTAGGSVYGHFVEADGVGSITAQTGDVGAIQVQSATLTATSTFALSLINGSWDVEAPKGSIYLQEVRNPNAALALFAHPFFFDYDPFASVSLNAGIGVAITGGANKPRGTGSKAIPIVLPPSLEVTTGAGGFLLYSSVTLFQSPYGNVNITDGGDFTGFPGYNGNIGAFGVPLNPQLYMSEAQSAQWSANNPFTVSTVTKGTYASPPIELNNPNPVVINVSGSLNNVDIYTTKETEITVAKDMNNSSFVGENLHPGDVSFVNVAGNVSYAPIYAFETLGQGINTLPFGPENPIQNSSWDTILYLMVNPSVAQNLVIPSGSLPSDLANWYNYFVSLATQQGLANPWAFYTTGGSPESANPGFSYNSTTLRFGFKGPMSLTYRNWLDGWNGDVANPVYNTTKINGVTYGQLYVVQFNASTGLPVVDSTGHLVLQPVTFVEQGTVNALYTASLGSGSPNSPAAGIQIGGPGALSVNIGGSLSLGDSQGIMSCGITGPALANTANVVFGYDPLGSLTDFQKGASVDVTVAGDVDMLTSRIASMYGGEVTVTGGGKMDLGSTEIPPGVQALAYGIYSTGGSDVNVTASGDINVNGARIATFNGGNIFVESYNGGVNVGSGGNVEVSVPLSSPVNLPGYSKLGPNNYYFSYPVFGSGIVAASLPVNLEPTGQAVTPGNITVETPKGNITSTQAGILQYALDGSTAAGPTITLSAGTPAANGNPAIQGNIDLGASGVIGGTVNLSAQGNVTGAIISRQDSTVNTTGNFVGTVLAGGTASLSAGGTVSGTFIGVGGVSVAGTLTAGSTVLAQNANVNGAQTDTLGSSAQAGTTSQNAAGTSSDNAKQQVASNDGGDSDDKKKKGQGTGLAKRSSRVTVIVPAGS